MIAAAQMLAFDVAVVAVAIVCIARHRATRRLHVRRVREILGRPAVRRCSRWRRAPLRVVVSLGAPARRQVVDARPDLRTSGQKQADQTQFNRLGLPRAVVGAR